MNSRECDVPPDRSFERVQDLLLDLACAPETLAFWETTCELLFTAIAFRFAVVWSGNAATLLTRQADGRFEKMANSGTASRDLHVGSVYNYLRRPFGRGVEHVDVNSFQHAPQRGHPQVQAHGCDDLITIVLRGDGWVWAHIALYRSPGDRLHSPDAVDRLVALFPTLERVVHHHWRLTQRDSFQTGMIDFLRDLPVGLAFFSWEERLLHANDEAYRQAHVWATAPEVRPVKQSELRKVFKLAPEINNAWATLRYERELSLARLEPMERTQLLVSHPCIAHLKAVIGITMDNLRPFRTPNFVVRFGGMTLAAASDAFEPTSTQLSALAELTPAERAVAVLAMRGLDNQSIAAQLNREVSTVKDHLTRIYAKLGVKSRSQLAGLRGG